MIIHKSANKIYREPQRETITENDYLYVEDITKFHPEERGWGDVGGIHPAQKMVHKRLEEIISI
jgi:hypothetical protein